MAKRDEAGRQLNEQQFLQGYADRVQQQRYDSEALPAHEKVPNPVVARAQAMQQPQRAGGGMANSYGNPYFNRPAQRCEMCGGIINFEDPQHEAWERKWSTHHSCAEAVWNQLDRRAGILTDRQQRR